MCVFKKTKNIFLTLLIIMAGVFSMPPPSYAQTAPSPTLPSLPNFFIPTPMLDVYVIEMSDGYKYFFCLDQHPYDLFSKEIIQDTRAVYQDSIDSTDLRPDGIIDLNKDGKVSGVECELYGGTDYDTAPLSPRNLTVQYGKSKNGVITIPSIHPGFVTINPWPLTPVSNPTSKPGSTSSSGSNSTLYNWP